MGPKKKPPWWNEKEACAKLYGSRCFVCHKKFGKRFTFHHKDYEEITTFYTDRDYHEKLYKDIRATPAKFLLLCNRHHYSIESLKKYNPKTLDRLIKAVKMSRYK